MWSRTDPATLLGAAVTGWAGVRAAFEWLGRRSPLHVLPQRDLRGRGQR